MTHFAARVASVACTALLTVAGTAGAARAEVPGCSGTSTAGIVCYPDGAVRAELPGCYGTSTVGFVCDATVVLQSPVWVREWRTPELCGSAMCDHLVVDAYWPIKGRQFRLCATLTDGYGHPINQCADLISISPTVVCAVLQEMHGTYGPVVVTEDGEVYVDTLLVWNCESGLQEIPPP